jgi:hypothetical protein
MINLVGQTFNRLTVLSAALDRRGRAAWVCVCVCGVITKPIAAYLLRNGDTRSCGCLGRERRLAGVTKHGHWVGRRASPTHQTWGDAKKRCFNPRHLQYRDYGARGITMCARWADSFQAFLDDMGEKPKGLTLGRIDNDGNYEPGNCRWETREQQGRNRTDNQFVTLGDVRLCQADWERSLGLTHNGLSERRYRHKISGDEALRRALVFHGLSVEEAIVRGRAFLLEIAA